MAATQTKITITECEDQEPDYTAQNTLTVRSTTSTASGLRNVMLDANNVTKIVPPDAEYYKNLSTTTKPVIEKSCSKKCGLTFVDFMPIFKRRNEGWFVQAGYEAFSELLDRLNHWLHSNPRWGCRVIETVYYDSGQHFNRTDSYMKKGRYQYELRGLRMWVSPKKRETTPQKIGCLFVIPKLKLGSDGPSNDFVEAEQLTTDRTLGANNFESLSELISRLNHNLQTDPLEGNIISIECVNIPILNYEIDVERVYYADNMYSDCDKLQLLKVYYEISDKTFHHTIGFKDFRPQNDIMDITAPYSSPQLVKYSKLLENANEYFKTNTDQHYLHSQTLEIPFTKYVNNDAQKVSCQEMYYCIDSSSQMRMKFLRAFYTTHSHRRFQVNEHQTFDLQSILFSPRFTEGHGFNHNDNFQILKARINHWLTTTTPKFLSIETIVTANESNPEEAIENCLKKLDTSEKHNYFVSFRISYAGPKVDYDFKAAAKLIDQESHDRQCTLM